MNNTLYKEVKSIDEKERPSKPIKLNRYIRYISIITVMYFILNSWFEFIYIPTTSMIPTLTTQTVYFCTKVHNWDTIQRGDIVTFRTNNNDEQLKGKEIVKRVIGLPHDVIHIDKNGALFINNTPYLEPYVKHMGGLSEITFNVPKDCYFLLGDNREASYDSRYWKNPFLNRDKIISKVKHKLIRLVLN